jgi:structure-specific recognition protein 1
MVKNNEEQEKKPAKRMTAYFLFMKENRAQIVKDNPGQKITEISKILGQKWRELSQE